MLPGTISDPASPIMHLRGKMVARMDILGEMTKKSLTDEGSQQSLNEVTQRQSIVV